VCIRLNAVLRLTIAGERRPNMNTLREMCLVVAIVVFQSLTTLSSHPCGAQSAPGAERLDAAIRNAWQREGIIPSAASDDSRYLRRIYLDIIGTIPSPQVVSDFI